MECMALLHGFYIFKFFSMSWEILFIECFIIDILSMGV